MMERRNFPKKPCTHILGTGGGGGGGIAVLLSTSDCTSNLPDWIQDISRIIIWIGWSEVKNAHPAEQALVLASASINNNFHKF